MGVKRRCVRNRKVDRVWHQYLRDEAENVRNRNRCGNGCEKRRQRRKGRKIREEERNEKNEKKRRRKEEEGRRRKRKEEEGRGRLKQKKVCCNHCSMNVQKKV